MKKKNIFLKKWWYILSVIVLIATTSSFYLNFIYENKSQIDQLNKNYLENLINLSKSVQSFEINTTNNPSIDLHRFEYQKLRSSYKKIGFLLSFLDPSFTRTNINGAPLPFLDESAAKVTVIEPRGFQVLDELLYSNDQVSEEIVGIEKNLISDLNRQVTPASSPTIDFQILMEAFRTGVLELMSLSSTGFEVPSGVSCLNDIENTLLGFQSITKNTFLEEPKWKKLISDNIRFVKKAKSFENLDRYNWYRKYLLPLYQYVAETHVKYELSLSNNETNSFSINLTSKNPFAADFLKTQSFLNQKIDSDFDKKIKLGELLFFDPILSGNNKRACASCHSPNVAFSDGLKTSLGIDSGVVLKRNSMSLINGIYSRKFFWDNRSSRLQSQLQHVIFNAQEFNTNYQSIIGRLEQSTEYQSMFNQLFEGYYGGSISSETIAQCLEAYVSSLQQHDTKLHKSMRNEIDLSSVEQKGFNLFTGKAACATCHFLPTFSGLVPPFFKESEAEVLGVPNNKKYNNLDNDLGKFTNGIILEESQIYKHSFKTVGLINISKTGPYMHNGVFDSLEEVMEFYNNGGGIGHGFKLENQTLPSDSLKLSESEISSIIQFMKTLDGEKEFKAPTQLPKLNNPVLDNRKIGGEY